MIVMMTTMVVVVMMIDNSLRVERETSLFSAGAPQEVGVSGGEVCVVWLERQSL